MKGICACGSQEQNKTNSKTKYKIGQNDDRSKVVAPAFPLCTESPRPDFRLDRRPGRTWRRWSGRRSWRRERFAKESAPRDDEQLPER